ncbi:hypothetical protein BaRGS_00036278 [Batillaria attramentaria]|uniref:Uncharacterized protein n=1 Tax=Batillaria attramentaria TaxID=370345 RepID=A0ABD0JC49_9CAEN
MLIISFGSHIQQSNCCFFYGYTGKPTKDPAHVRRLNDRKVGPDILFDDDTLLFESKDTFLSNPNNKQRFIDKLSKALMENGFHTAHASGDADCLIVQTSLKRARLRVTGCSDWRRY